MDELPSGHGQALLVLDDEPALVGLAEEMLSGMGYKPVGYTDPVAALEAIRTSSGRFVAVITDEMMPGLSGTQLAQALKTHAPHLPVLLVSGYGGPQLAKRASEAGVVRVLTKPLRRVELARVLADLLH
jgi:CheY-like chemotaxis protein